MGIGIFRGNVDPLVKITRTFDFNVGNMSRFEIIPNDIFYIREVSLAPFVGALSLFITIFCDDDDTGGFGELFSAQLFNSVGGRLLKSADPVNSASSNNSKIWRTFVLTHMSASRAAAIITTNPGFSSINVQRFLDQASNYYNATDSAVFATGSILPVTSAIRQDSVLLANYNGGGFGGSPRRTINMIVTGIY